MPDREVGLGARGPGVRRAGRRFEVVERAGDHGDLRAPPFVVGDDPTRNALVPKHREVGLDHLVGRRQVEPDLKELARVRAVAVEQREHLTVHDPLAGGQPLHVAPAEPSGRAKRIRVVDEPLAHEGHRFEAAVRVLREARHRASVVHPPTVGPGEVHAEVSRLERRRRTHVLVGLRILVQMVHAEEERIDGHPLKAEWDGLEQGISHVLSVRACPGPRESWARAQRS